MGINYGSNSNDFIPIYKYQIGTQEKQSPGFSFISILKGILVVGEIASSFFLGPVGTIGVELATASAFTAIDAKQGNLSIPNLAINFGSVAIGIASALKIGNRFHKALSSGIEQELSETEKAISKLVKKPKSKRTGIKKSITKKNMQQKLNNLQKIYEELSSASKFENKKTFLKKVNKLELEFKKGFFGPSSFQKISSESFLENLIKKGTVTKTLSKEEILFIKNVKTQQKAIQKILKKDQRKIFTQLMDQRTRISDLSKLSKALRSTLSKNQISEISLISSNFRKFLRYGARPLSLKNSNFKNFLKYAGTSEYNDKVVQRIQNIDANNAGRYIVERPYQWAKKQLRKTKINWIKKGIKYDAKIENAWTKAGGVWLGGRYIDGYKVIPLTQKKVGPFGTQAVLIRFNKSNTAAKNKEWNGKRTNNFGGKKDVIVTASSYELKQLREYGGQYYNQRWARTKGGHAGIWSRAGSISISNELSLFLGFFPNNPLRLNLSIISNITETLYDIHLGVWHKQFGKKFLRAFERSVVNRSVRLFTREVLPKFGVKKQVTREISRFATSTLTQFETIKKGNFTFKIPTAISLGRSIAGSSIAGTRSGLLRNARSKGLINITRTLGSTRQLQQGIRRIPGSVTPNKAKVYNPRTFLNIKL